MGYIHLLLFFSSSFGIRIFPSELSFEICFFYSYTEFPSSSIRSLLM